MTEIAHDKKVIPITKLRDFYKLLGHFSTSTQKKYFRDISNQRLTF